MNARPQYVDTLVRRGFERPDLVRVVRGTIVRLAADVLLGTTIILADELWLQVALGVWLACRLVGLAFLRPAAKVMEEKHRRLEGLPAHWLLYLRTGKVDLRGIQRDAS